MYDYTENYRWILSGQQVISPAVYFHDHMLSGLA